MEIHPDLSVYGLVIHRVEKGIGKDQAPIVEYGEEVLPNDQKTTRFANLIHDELRMSRTRGYGDFRTGPTQSYFYSELSGYVSNRSERAFYSLSTGATDSFSREIGKAAAAIGGYLAFLHFEVDGKEYLDVLLLNDTESLAVSEDLHLSSVEHLDLNDYAFAARVYVDRLVAGEPSHVAYITGSRGEPSLYFRDFVGADLTGAKEESEALRKAIMDYTLEMAPEVMQARRHHAEEYMLSLYKQDRPGSLNTVAEFVDPEQPSRFIEFATGPEYQAVDSFGVHKSTVLKLSSIRITSEGITLAVARDRLSKVMIDGESVIIRDAPARVLAEVRKYVRED